MKKTHKIWLIVLAAVVLIAAGVTAAICFWPRGAAPSGSPTAAPSGSQMTEPSATEAPDGLPRLCLDGDISQMLTKEDVRNVSVRYEADGRTFEGYAELKIQGGSSLEYEKQNYTIKLFQDATHQKKLKVDMGWGEENRYCLKANWVDKTHSRNIVSANLVAEAQKKYGLLMDTPNNGAIDGFPIEIYSNGEFLGLYTFNIPKHEWLFNMDDENPNHIVMESVDWQPSNLFKERADFTSWNVEVGEESQQTLDKFNRVFDFVLNSSDAEFREHFEEYINLDAALNYYVFAEVAFLGDNVGKNMLMVTYDGQVWYPCLYDLDTSWGPWWDGKGLNDYRNNMLNMTDNYLFQRIHDNFGAELAQRYFELREEILSKKHIMDEFEAFQDLIPAAAFAKETERWGTDIPGYSILQVKDYLNTMLPRLDDRYRALRDAS